MTKQRHKFSLVIYVRFESGVQARLPHCGMFVFVTYEYDSSALLNENEALSKG